MFTQMFGSKDVTCPLHPLHLPPGALIRGQPRCQGCHCVHLLMKAHILIKLGEGGECQASCGMSKCIVVVNVYLLKADHISFSSTRLLPCLHRQPLLTLNVVVVLLKHECTNGFWRRPMIYMKKCCKKIRCTGHSKKSELLTILTRQLKKSFTWFLCVYYYSTAITDGQFLMVRRWRFIFCNRIFSRRFQLQDL